MAEIYLASIGDQTSEKRVAIKVIHPQNATDPDFVRMLIDEAKLAVQLDHPNIVRTYDLGRETDEYYIVMDFIDGADLFKVQQRAAIKRLSFPIALGAFVTRQVTRALHFAHRLKDRDGRLLYIVHRDISPQNVLVSYDGEVKITDFGIAKAAYRAEQTQAGIIKGKYYYMSPEQAMGRLIDARTDIFAAGILLYEMLIGEMLYYDDDLDKLLAMVRRADIVPPSKRRRDVPPALEAIVMKALRKKPEERYQTAEEYGLALEGFLRDFAPNYGPDDLGVFVVKVMDTTRNRGSGRVSQENTQQLRVDEDMDPTRGLTDEQLDSLGVHDENSLIFQPAEKLQAMLRAAAAGQGQSPSSPPVRADQSGALESRGQDDSGMLTRRRFLDKKMEVDPSLLDEATIPDPVRLGPEKTGTKPSGIPGAVSNAKTNVKASEKKAGPPGDWNDEMEGQRTNPVPDEQRGVRRNFTRRMGAVPIGSSSDEVHELPTVSHDAVAPVRAIPVGSAADEEHDAVTAPRPAETAHLARISMEIPALDVDAARAAYNASEAKKRAQKSAPTPAKSAGPVGKDGSRSLVFELMPQPAVAESQVELVMSDDGFAHVKPDADETKVELKQADDYKGSAQSVAPAAGKRGLDAISLEGTGSGITEARRAELSAGSITGIQPVQVRSRGRLGYVIAGLGAAAISAILTWRITVAPRTSKPPIENSTEDGGATGLPTLVLYDVPDSEPAPAPLVISEAPTKPPGNPETPSEGTTKSETPSESGEVEVNSTPEGAEVYVKHKLVGKTPLVLHELPLSSPVKFELRLEGFKKKKKRIKWKGETHLSVNVKMSEGESEDEGESSSESSPAPSADPAAKPASE